MVVQRRLRGKGRDSNTISLKLRWKSGLEDDLHHRWKGGHVLKAKLAWQRCRTIGELREALANEFDHPPSLVTFHTAGHEAAAGFGDDRCVNSIDGTDAIELMVVCHAEESYICIICCYGQQC